jgi:hypothetical protein
MVFFAIVNTIGLYGQGQSNFEKTFLKETQAKESGFGGFGKFKNISSLSYYPDTIPTWFFNPPFEAPGSIFAIGISDPDMTIEEAIGQAIYRAKVMAVLFNKSQIQYFRDVYTTEQVQGKYSTYRQRFDTYFKVSGAAYVDSSQFKVVSQHFTRYNEAVILIQFNSKSLQEETPKQMISTVATVLYIEAQVGDAFEPQAEYEFISALRVIGKPLYGARSMYRQKGNKFLAQSEFLGQEITFPLYYYKYANPNWANNTEPLVCYNGLWSQYTKEMLKQLTLATEQSKVKFKTMGSQQTGDNSNLFREIAVKTAQLNLIGIDFGNDSIGFNFQINELVNK